MPERRVTLDVNTCSPENLSSLSEDEFRAVVEADLRRKSPKGSRLRADLSAALRSEDHVHRWHATLCRMQRSVDGQLGARDCDLAAELARIDAEIFVITDRMGRGETVRDDGTGLTLSAEEATRKVASLKLRRITRRAEHNETRAGTLRFKTGLEETLAEARFLRERTMIATFEGALTHERNHLSQRCYRLTAAIERHRAAVREDLGGDEPDEIDTELWRALPPSPTEPTPHERGSYETDAGRQLGPNRPGSHPERRELVGAAEA